MFVNLLSLDFISIFTIRMYVHCAHLFTKYGREEKKNAKEIVKLSESYGMCHPNS